MEKLENYPKVGPIVPDWEAAVTEFHRKYGFPIGEEWSDGLLFQRLQLITEEISELVEAAANRDEEGLLDAVIDLLYVTVGTAVALGLPLGEAFIEVHKSNMTKTIHRDRPGHPGKGGGYFPPDLKKVLFEQRKNIK